MTAPTDRPTASRRELLFATAGGLALSMVASRPAFAAGEDPSPQAPSVPFVEHKILHDGHAIYAREYPGKGPAYVLIHGFPDNLHIYDYVVPYLVKAGKRVVSFDFLGFGQSDKVSRETYPYSFAQQVGDLSAVVDALRLDTFIPVGHDSGGPCAINYAIDHPERIAWLCVMNCFYAQSPTFRLPEIIEVFGNPSLQELAKTILTTPEQMNWLLSFQDAHFQAKMPPEQRARFTGILRPIVRKNFADGAASGFQQMTAQVYDNVAYNTSRLPDVAKFKPKVSLIWGTLDPYLTPGGC